MRLTILVSKLKCLQPFFAQFTHSKFEMEVGLMKITISLVW